MRSLTLVVLVACSKPAPQAPVESSGSMLDCTAVADHVAATVAADKPRPGATLDAVKDLVATRCKADAWTEDTKQCLRAIATIRDGRACAENMTDEQRTAIRTQARALRKDEPPPPDDGNDWIRHVVEEAAP